MAISKKSSYQKINSSDNESQLSMVKKFELKNNDFLVLKEECKKRDIKFLCSPFDINSATFLNKIGLICTHSGGDGAKFLSSMKLQLEHLGVTVMPRYISVTNSKEFNNESAYKILKHFINLL